MNQVPRQKLVALVARFGRDICEDARRCEALLRDVCGDQYKREVFVLVSAVKDGVAPELAAGLNGIPWEVLLARFSNRLHNNLGLAEDLARWSVETWALAFGILPIEMAPKPAELLSADEGKLVPKALQKVYAPVPAWTAGPAAGSPEGSPEAMDSTVPTRGGGIRGVISRLEGELKRKLTAFKASRPPRPAPPPSPEGAAPPQTSLESDNAKQEIAGEQPPPAHEDVPAADAATTKTVREMLNTDGFAGWLEMLPRAKRVEVTEKNVDRIGKLHTAFEAEKKIGADIERVCDEFLTGHADKALLRISPICYEELDDLRERLSKEALANPDCLTKLEADIAAFKKIPQDIAAKEQELVALQAKSSGFPELDRQMSEVKDKLAACEAKIDSLATAPRLGWKERISFQFFKELDDVGFEEEKRSLQSRYGSEAGPRIKRLERFQKIAKADREALEKEVWQEEIARLDARITELEPKFTEANNAKVAAERIAGEAQVLKESIQQKRSKIFSQIPGSADLHRRARLEIHNQLFDALTSTDINVVDEAAEQFSRLETLSLAEGRGGNYLSDFSKNTKMTIDEYKGAITEQIKVLVGMMLENTLAQMYPGELYGAFERDLEDFIARETKNLGFEDKAKSRAFLIAELEKQKVQPDPARSGNIEYLISEMTDRNLLFTGRDGR